MGLYSLGPAAQNIRDICACRTGALGAHIEQCDNCSQQIIAYDSCRNRHCPKCLFRAVSETLLTIAADLRHLGTHVGFLAVLHTWNQKMLLNPHS
jgi:hypothetical protein